MERNKEFAVIPLDLIRPELVDNITQIEPATYPELLKNIWKFCNGQEPDRQKTRIINPWLERIDLDDDLLPISKGDIYHDQQLFNVTRVKFRRRKA